jgi:NAD-dependent dihydropyrimidine dehydrogenase PreA subunit
MKRKIISVDEEKCNGCGLCIPACHEGALQVIDGKVRLISDHFCDGLGDCIGHCPEGAITIEEREAEPYDEVKVSEPENIPSELRQWPVQLHLLNPQASYFRDADVLLAADCVAFSMGDFHPRFLKGKSLAIACPKLDTNKESYVQKLTAMIRDAGVRSLTVMIMEVPCCGGLVQMARIAREQAGSNIPMNVKVIGVKGELVDEQAA